MIGRSLTENDLYLSFVFLLVFVFSIVFFPFPSSCWSTHLVWLGPSLAEDGLKSLDPVDQRISPRESFIYVFLDKPGRKKKTERTGILEALVTWKTEEGHFLQFRHLHSVGSFSIVTHLKEKKLFGHKNKTTERIVHISSSKPELALYSADLTVVVVVVVLWPYT